MFCRDSIFFSFKIVFYNFSPLTFILLFFENC
nr:MAG TPA: hypothetical protein [Bacteriophage sp.]